MKCPIDIPYIYSYYWYIPVITAVVVAVFFPSGKSRTTKPKAVNEGGNEGKLSPLKGDEPTVTKEIKTE